MLYVVDFKNMQIKFLDNRTYESTELKTIKKLTNIVVDQLDYVLENQKSTLTEKIIKLKFKLIPPNWKSSKDVDNESAIYLMMTMLLFDGEKYPKCVELTKARQRKYLRAEICATLVLSDMNARRNEIVDRCKVYNTNKEEREQIVAQRRKQRLAEEKKFNAIKQNVLEKHQKKTNMEAQPRRNEKRNVQKKHCCSGK